METIITIRRNTPIVNALIHLAQELQRYEHNSISISGSVPKKEEFDIIPPSRIDRDPSIYFDQLADFPTLEEIRAQIVGWVERSETQHPMLMPNQLLIVS